MSTLYRYFSIVLIGLAAGLFSSSVLPVRAQESSTVFLPLLRSTSDEERQFAAAGDVEVEYTGRDDIPPEVWPVLASIIERETTEFTEKKFFTPSAIDMFEEGWVAGIIVIPDSKGQTTLIGLPGFTVIMTRDASGWYGHTEFDPAYLDLLSRIPGGYIDGLNKPVRSASTDDTSAVEHKFPWAAGEKWTSSPGGFHYGGIEIKEKNNIDFFPPGNSSRKILASAKGKLIKICDSPQDPTQVAFFILHDDESKSEYIHIDKASARTDLHNKSVPQGQELGTYYPNAPYPGLGCGYGNPEHLHFGLSDTSAKIQGIQFRDIRPSTTYESTNSSQKCPNDNPAANQVIFYRDKKHTGDCAILQLGEESTTNLPSGDVNSIKVGSNVMAKLWDGNDTSRIVYCYRSDKDLEDENEGYDGCDTITKVAEIEVLARDTSGPTLVSVHISDGERWFIAPEQQLFLIRNRNLKMQLRLLDKTPVDRVEIKWERTGETKRIDAKNDSVEWSFCDHGGGAQAERFVFRMYDVVGNKNETARTYTISYPDLNDDCKIDILDLIELIKGVFGGGGTLADINNDGKKDILDIIALIKLIFGDVSAAGTASGGNVEIGPGSVDNVTQLNGLTSVGTVPVSRAQTHEIRASDIHEGLLYVLEGTTRSPKPVLMNVYDTSQSLNTPIASPEVYDEGYYYWISDVSVSADELGRRFAQIIALNNGLNSEHITIESADYTWAGWANSHVEYNDKLIREVETDPDYPWMNAILFSSASGSGGYGITAWPGTSGEMTYRTDLKLRGLRIVPDNPDPYIMAIEGSDRVWIAVASAFTDAGTSGEGLLGSNMVDMDVADRITDDPWSSAFVYAFADTEDGLIIAVDDFTNAKFVPLQGRATSVALSLPYAFLGTADGDLYQVDISPAIDGLDPIVTAKTTGLGEIFDLQVENGRLYVTTPSLIHVLGFDTSSYPVFEINGTVVGEGSIIKYRSLPCPGSPLPFCDYYHGEEITLSAVSEAGWRFVRWEGDLSGTDAEEMFEINRSMDVTAVFEEIVYPEYPVDIIVTGNGSATISPQQEVYREGDQVSLNATAEPGWRFTHWRLFEDENEQTFSDQEFSLQISTSTTIFAYFEEEEQLPAENTISLGTTSVEQGQSTTVNLDVFAIGEEVNYVELYIWYDASLVKPTECVRSPESVFQNGTFICAFSNLFDDFSPILITWVASGPGFTGKETISLFFEATDRTGGTSPLTIEVIGYGLLDLSTYAVTNFPHAVVNGGIQVLGEPIDTALGSVSISGPTTGDIDTPHSFSATVYPADATGPIEYTWSPEPSAGQGTANATYTWSTAGAKQITVAAANGSSTVNAEHNIQIDEPTNTVALQDVNIIAPYIGSIMTLHSFSAQTSPFNASTPLQYSWSPEPQSGQGTELAYYAWWNVGTYQVTVTVSNQVGSVSDIHNIQIVYDPASLERVFIPYIAR